MVALRLFTKTVQVNIIAAAALPPLIDSIDAHPAAAGSPGDNFARILRVGSAFRSGIVLELCMAGEPAGSAGVIKSGSGVPIPETILLAARSHVTAPLNRSETGP